MLNNYSKYLKLLGRIFAKQLFFILILLTPISLFSINKLEVPNSVLESKQIERKNHFNSKRDFDPQLFSRITNKDFLEDLKVINTDWIQLGPNSLSYEETNRRKGIGRFNCIAFDPNNPDNFWAGASSGGIWKSTNAGRTWTYVKTGFMNTGITDIFVSESGKVFALTGDYVFGGIIRSYSVGILVSSDNGQNWETLPFSVEDNRPDKFGRIWVDPNDDNRIICTSYEGIYVSNDGGESAVIHHPELAFFDIEQDPVNSNSIYCATYSFNGNGYVYKSINSGNSFQQMVFFVDAGNIELAVMDGEEDRIYALCSDANNQRMKGLWISNDGGVNWYEQNVEVDLVEAQGFYNLSMDVSKEGQIVAGGINLFFQNEDGWVKNTSLHVDQQFIKFNPHNDELYVCNDGGIYKWRGEDWEFISQNIPVTEFYQISSNRYNGNMLIGGSQDNGVLLKNYNNWEHIISGDAFMCHYNNEKANEVNASIQRGTIFRSTNHGFSFNKNISPQISNPEFYTRFKLDPLNSNVIYYYTDKIYKSQDAGESWMEFLDLSEYGSINDLEIFEDHLIIAAGRNLIRYSNSMEILNPFEKRINSIRSFGDSIAVVLAGTVGYRFGIFNKSNNSVIYPEINLPEIPSNDIEIFDDDGFYRIFIGTDIGVFEIIDESAYLLQNESIPYMIISQIEINKSTDKLIAASYGNSLWELSLNRCNEEIFTLNNSDKIIKCENEEIVLRINEFIPSDYEIQWSNGNKTDSLIVNDEGFYYATIISSNKECIYATNAVEVEFIETPEINLSVIGKDNPCEGDTLTLIASTDINLDRERTKWSDGSNGEFIYVTEEGEYFLEYEQESGCKIISEKFSATFLEAPTKPQISKSGNYLMSDQSADWYLNGELIQRSSNEIIISERGVYYCSVENQNSCISYSDELDIGSEKILFNLYPSPFQDVIKIEIVADLGDQFSIKIYDIKGKEKYSENVIGSKDYYFRTIDLKDISDGVYFIELILEKEIFTKKVIKIKG